MFAKKLIFIAAAIALAVTPAVASDKHSTHLKIHINHAPHHKQVLNATETTATEEDDEAPSTDGSTDDEDDEVGEEESAPTEKDETTEEEDETAASEEGEEVVGEEKESEEEEEDETGSASASDEDAEVGEEVAAPHSAACTGEGESPMSVEGVEGVFCVKGVACAADVDGVCPEKQDGLELGSYCGENASGVLGCLEHTEETLKNTTALHRAAAHVAKNVDAKFFVRKNHAKHHSKPVVKKVTHKKTEHKKPVVKVATHKKAEHKKPVVKVTHKKTEAHKKPVAKKETHKHH